MLGVALGILLPALFLAYFQVTAKLKTELALRVEAPMRQYAEVLSRGMAVADITVVFGQENVNKQLRIRAPQKLPAVFTQAAAARHEAPGGQA